VSQGRPKPWRAAAPSEAEGEVEGKGVCDVRTAEREPSILISEAGCGKNSTMASRINGWLHLRHLTMTPISAMTTHLFERRRWPTACASALALIAGSIALAAAPARQGPFFLPSGAAEKIVSVSKTGTARAGITVLTEAVAVKETGPAPTIKKFGEVYAFNPSFIAVRREQPTQIEFWNLQPDDEHDFALLGPALNVLMYVKLPPLQKTSYIFTFHKEGEIEFKCLRHQPEMSGQILVLPPVK